MEYNILVSENVLLEEELLILEGFGDNVVFKFIKSIYGKIKKLIQGLIDKIKRLFGKGGSKSDALSNADTTVKNKKAQAKNVDDTGKDVEDNSPTYISNCADLDIKKVEALIDKMMDDVVFTMEEKRFVNTKTKSGVKMKVVNPEIIKKLEEEYKKEVELGRNIRKPKLDITPELLKAAEDIRMNDGKLIYKLSKLDETIDKWYTKSLSMLKNNENALDNSFNAIYNLALKRTANLTKILNIYIEDAHRLLDKPIYKNLPKPNIKEKNMGKLKIKDGKLRDIIPYSMWKKAFFGAKSSKSCKEVVLKTKDYSADIRKKSRISAPKVKTIEEFKKSDYFRTIMDYNKYTFKDMMNLSRFYESLEKDEDNEDVKKEGFFIIDAIIQEYKDAESIYNYVTKVLAADSSVKESVEVYIEESFMKCLYIED